MESIRLCNLQGKLIQEFFTNDFSVSNLSAGIYYIIIQTGKSTFTHKLVKQ
ncbi:MAG: T9SS type A sorting domain-containing protein [Bacteroidales bacterium]|nr:T9SS type A sorting domain-containing protein [Bacteroidales bacterium]